jgi:carboxylesterase|tara:strand:+ start:938 stop:1702 length:765 start_codon:yes stop_codon:yes gene_type:complete
MKKLLTPRISSKSFRFDGNSGVACYMIHGYTGSTFEMEKFGKFLSSNGITAVADLLPGHGTSVRDCNSRTHYEWLQSVEEGYDILAKEFNEIFIIGFSMGCTLAFHIAIERDPKGLVVMSPAMFKFKSRKIYLSPILCYFKEYQTKTFTTSSNLKIPAFGYAVYPIKAGREALRMTIKLRRQLNHVKVPTLVMHSTKDITAPYENGPKVYEAIGAQDKEFIKFERSTHMLMYDCEKELVWDAALTFLRKRSKIL